MSRLDEILNGGMGVALGRVRVFVAGENLCEFQVFCLTIEIGYRGMPKAVKVVRPLNPGILLPFLKT